MKILLAVVGGLLLLIFPFIVMKKAKVRVSVSMIRMRLSVCLVHLIQRQKISLMNIQDLKFISS